MGHKAKNLRNEISALRTRSPKPRDIETEAKLINDQIDRIVEAIAELEAEGTLSIHDMGGSSRF